MKRNLVGKILGKIKIFVQDFVPIITALAIFDGKIFPQNLVKKLRFLYKILFKNQEGRDSLYFQVFPRHFFFMRGHSLVELTEHDDSAADIIVLSMYAYMYCCVHIL